MGVDDFRGPGSYVGDVFFKPNDEGDLYTGASLCGLEIDSTAAGGIEGTINCSILGLGGTVNITGNFQCGVDSMDTLFAPLTDRES